MQLRTTLAIIILHVAGLAACQNDERVKGWNADIDAYIDAVKQDHYVYKSQTLPASFQRIVKELRPRISSYSDQRMLFELEHLAAQLGDGHTYILPWAAERVESRVLPLRFYLFDDGLFVIDARAPYETYIGARVERFGSRSAKDALTLLSDYVSRDNEMGIHWIGPLFLRFQGAMEILGVSDGDEVVLELTMRDGKSKKQPFGFVPVERMRGVPKLVPSRISQNPPPLYLGNVSQAYWIKSLRDKVVFVQFNQVMNDPTESLTSFANRLGDTLIAQKPRHLVIDVRHNNGGDATLLGPLLEELRGFRKDEPNARLTLITGRNTFSACQIFISLADAQVRPVFAGERSSSKPNFVGEEHEIVLPWSGARGSISNRYHETIPGDSRQWIDVTIPVPLLSRDYFENRDPVLDKLGIIR